MLYWSVNCVILVCVEYNIIVEIKIKRSNTVYTGKRWSRWGEIIFSFVIATLSIAGITIIEAITIYRGNSAITSTLMGLIFASSKSLHFARTYFREWAVLQFFARIYFRESAMLRIFVNTNFHESAILRYSASTYIWESIVFSFSRILIFANRTSSNFSRGLNFANLTKIREIREN